MAYLTAAKRLAGIKKFLSSHPEELRCPTLARLPASLSVRFLFQVPSFVGHRWYSFHGILFGNDSMPVL
jgi:hypothetical protein